MIKDFLNNINFQKNKKFILGGFVVFIILSLGVSYCSSPVKNTARKDLILTIPAMGGLPALDQGMDSNRALRAKVDEILSYDEAYLFVNYVQVNNLVTEIMFLWIGLTPEQIQNNKTQKLAEIFLRKLYNLPNDEPIRGNPFLEDKPWGGVFQKIKAKLLMQGQGHKIFDGVAYYDSEKDIMVVEGGLSKTYLKNLGQIITTLPQDKQRKYKNNYLLFVDNTLGLKNLSDAEKEMLKDNGFL